MRRTLLLALLVALAPARARPAGPEAGVAAATSEDGPNGHRLVRIPAGVHRVGGSERRPAREVRLGAFAIATDETTVAQFERFVAATGFRTDAERKGYGLVDPPDAPLWTWERTPGATWRAPRGLAEPAASPGEPVTQVSADDARAYCAWAGLRLPTLDEWEVAARAGATTRFPWGDELSPPGAPRANVWSGPDGPAPHGAADGFLHVAPVGSFPPNAWGLHDVIGNVFEYCDDPGTGPAGDPDPGLCTGRGGSWWCGPERCDAMDLVTVGQMSRSRSLANQGFRVAR